jgi:tetratricopeptide (TPR) repeat protein
MLGGMPLGIELAAAWMRLLSLAEIASRLERGIDLLRSSARDVPTRHRSITAAFDYSWRMLSSQERSILRQLALFCGGCTVEAAIAVTGATLLDLASLADKSWLRIEPSGQGPEASNRCTLHALVHQYCAEKLAVEHEREAREPPDQARDRHTAYYLARLKARREIVTTWQDRFLPLLADLENYNAIWRRAIEGNRFETLRDLFAVVGYPDASARTQLQLLEQAQHVLQARLKTSAATDPSCEATLCLIELLRHRAGCFSRLGQLTRAAADLETSLGLVDAVARAPGSIEARFRLRHAQTFLLQDRGDFAAALQLRRALLTELPDIHAHLWPYQPDRTLIYWQAEITSALFYPLFRLGQYAEAEVVVRQALQWFESLPWACNANALANLGLLYYVRGNYSEALRLAAESLRANQTHGQRGHSFYSLLTMAQAEIALGRLMEATTHYRQTIAGARACDRPAAIARGMTGLAEVELAMNRPDKAKEAYEAVITYYEQNGLEWGDIQAVALIGAGRTACMLSDPATAEESFVGTLRCRGCSATDLMEALAGLAQVRVMRGARAGAIELLSFVIAHPFTSHRVRQPMIRLLAKLEGEQPPEAFAAAVARGRGRGLEELVTELSRGR